MKQPAESLTSGGLFLLIVLVLLVRVAVLIGLIVLLVGFVVLLIGLVGLLVHILFLQNYKLRHRRRSSMPSASGFILSFKEDT